jgi:uncharacterized protein YjiS (DUF1127 family)
LLGNRLPPPLREHVNACLAQAAAAQLEQLSGRWELASMDLEEQLEALGQGS